ncbi:DUF2007 domain-containing protein [Flexithrix dorotheae]|uniref:putative signal transducing protein n=1 Tax=Flexithrix dorotheae TaxID=70993 RepID=UPI00037AEFBA|nr:DUF2007 domain-containing protein [Flexithrix dorotheae]
MNNWKKVYSTNETHKAEIVKLTIENHNIPAVILNKRDSSIYNFFGEREIYVANENENEALKIIENEISFT